MELGRDLTVLVYLNRRAGIPASISQAYDDLYMVFRLTDRVLKEELGQQQCYTEMERKRKW